MKPSPRLRWAIIRRFAAIVSTPPAVKSAFIGHPLLRAWWKCILFLHGRPRAKVIAASEYWDCIAEGFRFYGWLYRVLALVVTAVAGWALATGVAGFYWLAFLFSTAVGFWSAAGLAFAGANTLQPILENGLWKLVAFLFLISITLASILVAVSAEVRAAELITDEANVALTISLLIFGVGSYLVEVLALVTAVRPLEYES